MLGTVDATTPSDPTGTLRARRAALAAFLGGALEYYDFFVYTTAAALVFGHVFFPAGDPTVGLIQSFAVFGVGYVFRPLGGIVFGHLGDRIGRKNTLLVTLVVMGGASFLIGVLPTYATAGYLAPGLLVLLRILQGLSAGGETAGASALTVEEAPAGRRAFFASFTSSGISTGTLLASLVFLPVAAMPAEARDAWGWRIPFWLSIVVVVVGYVVRRRLEEPEVFVDEQRRGEVPSIPLLELFRSSLRPLVVVAVMSLFIVINTFMQSFGLAFATQVGTFTPSQMLWANVAGGVVAVVSQPLIGLLADRIGRRPVFLVGMAGSMVLAFVYFSAISAGNLLVVVLATCAVTGVTYAMANGIYTSWFAEQFPVRVRYTGLAVALQIGILLAGFTPAAGTALVDGRIERWLPAALIVAGAALVAGVGAVFARETYRVPLAELGEPVRRAAARRGDSRR